MSQTENPPGDWIMVDATTYKHTNGVELDIGETQGGYYRVDKVDNIREPIGDGETLHEAKQVAIEYMEENP